MICLHFFGEVCNFASNNGLLWKFFLKEVKFFFWDLSSRNVYSPKRKQLKMTIFQGILSLNFFLKLSAVLAKELKTLNAFQGALKTLPRVVLANSKSILIAVPSAPLFPLFMLLTTTSKLLCLCYSCRCLLCCEECLFA